MTVYDQIDQRSEEWFRIRAGRPTASEFHRIITPKGKTDRVSWRSYALELIAESIRPDEVQWAGNRHTDRGNELESEALVLFAEKAGKHFVNPVGFVLAGDGISGCSPDALIRDAVGNWCAGLEVKCPAPKTHVDYLLAPGCPDTHKVQVHGSLAVTGLPAWYFMSYCPGMKEAIRSVEPNEFTEQVAEALKQFIVYYRGLREELIPKLIESE